MNRNTYVRVADGVPVSENEALTASGALKLGYKTWVSLPLWLKDSAPGGQASSPSRIFVNDGQEKVTLTDSDIAYYQMVALDQNAWRNAPPQSGMYQADNAQTVQLGDAYTEWAKMVAHDQNAWKTARKGA